MKMASLGLVFNIMKDSFYMYASTKNYFWKKAADRLWQHCDRRYMKSTIYPAVGSYLKNSKTKRVLDIGAKWYNKTNRDLFLNNDIFYWVIDVSKKPKYLKCDKFLRVSILDLPDIYHNLGNYFDVVISYGVLGFIKFDNKSVNKYLESVFRILKPSGIFLLKLDTFFVKGFEKEFQIDFDAIHKYFTPCSVADLPEEKLVSDGEESYTFYTLRKRSLARA
jgi:SAM-dependent methyltransferase